VFNFLCVSRAVTVQNQSVGKCAGASWTKTAAGFNRDHDRVAGNKDTSQINRAHIEHKMT